MLTVEIHLPSFLFGAGCACFFWVLLLKWTMQRLSERSFAAGVRHGNRRWVAAAQRGETLTFDGVIYRPHGPADARHETDLHLLDLTRPGE